jgi:hypothetical protein
MGNQFSASTSQMVEILTVAAKACLQFGMGLHQKRGRLPHHHVAGIGALIVGISDVGHQRIGVHEPPQPTIFWLGPAGQFAALDSGPHGPYVYPEQTCGGGDRRRRPTGLRGFQCDSSLQNAHPFMPVIDTYLYAN